MGYPAALVFAFGTIFRYTLRGTWHLIKMKFVSSWTASFVPGAGGIRAAKALVACRDGISHGGGLWGRIESLRVLVVRLYRH